VRSLLIEFHRFGDPKSGLIRQGDTYLVAAASHPVRQASMPLDYESFLDLMLALRYQAGAAARQQAIDRISRIVTDLLGSKDLDELEGGDFPLQLDLVVNAAELAALPFEAAIDRAGEPLVLRTKRPIVLTRRVRNDFTESIVRWPSTPRILYAWAYPHIGGAPVPYEAHEHALRTALLPWIPSEGPHATRYDFSGTLRVLEKASLDSIRELCQDAVDKKKPFTHVHLLAHGYPIGDLFKRRFGLALHAPASDDLDPVSPEALVEALAPLRGHASVLSLSACDSANEANTIIPRGSIAHELHVSGFPVVLASQLPLTVAGSIILVENFYRELLAGADVRSALHRARCALFDNKSSTGHDWASVVGYVRLPEGYADYLPTVRLESALSSLKAIQAWSDELLASDVIDAARFNDLAGQLRAGIERLEAFLTDTPAALRGVVEEYLGLLGSAQKRLAELYFASGKRGGGDGWQKLMREALERARGMYQKGYETNLSHHWTGVQFISLDAVLAGKIVETDRWYAAALAATLDAKRPDEIWAYGSLAELHLLATAAGLGDHADQAQKAIEEMISRVARLASGDRFPLESTERQLRRYVDWWTAANGFFPGQPDLSRAAGRLASLIQNVA
jgi:hypothetical protein